MRKKSLTLGLTLAYGILSAQVGINTNEPTNTLDVNGDIRVRDIDKLSGNIVQPLYINEEGIIGLTPESDQVTSRVFSAVANTTNIVSTNKAQLDTYNVGGNNYISLQDSFIKENTLDIHSNGDFFIFNESGTYLINLYINFQITVESGDAYILAHLQTKNQGESTWSTIVANRQVVRNEGYSKVNRPMVFPAKIVKIEKGSEMRLIFTRTKIQGGELQGNKLTYLQVGSATEYGLDGVSMMITKL